MKYLFLILGLFISSKAYSEVTDSSYSPTNFQNSSFHLVDVDRLSLQGAKIQENRDPQFPGKQDWNQKGDLYFNFRLFKYIFMENDIETMTDQRQFREVGWHFTAGIYLFDPHFAFVHEHFSKHSLDVYEGTGYPVQDTFGFRINFIGR